MPAAHPAAVPVPPLWPWETDDAGICGPTLALRISGSRLILYLPNLSFLDEKPKIRRQINTDELQAKARILKKKLEDFKIMGEGGGDFAGAL